MPSVSMATYRLLQRVLSPLCGLSQMIAFSLRSRSEAKFITSGGELTGVHVWLNQSAPRPGAHHIGASACSVDACLIKTLGETIERYSHYSIAKCLNPRFASLREMKESSEPVPDLSELLSWTEEQVRQERFPFRQLQEDHMLGWIQSVSTEGEQLWLPAQMVLVGYNARKDLNEPWLLPAVTTGTAAHTDHIPALRNALLEIVQLDAAMGHWFTNTYPVRIVLDERTLSLSQMISRTFSSSELVASFFWLRSPDLFGTSIACVLENQAGRTPAIAIGLGSDWNLEQAMYKALLESLGVLQLAKLVTLSTHEINANSISDLDSNVAWYGQPEHAAIVRAKFFGGPAMNACDMEADFAGTDVEGIDKTVRSFTAAGKRLFIYDFTTPDIRDLGFCAVRAFCPDTLSLCLPSFPPKANRRFEAYGGFANVHPHPFP
jgi:thiazole/oxazole-forming peptide maturase SagD family component